MTWPQWSSMLSVRRAPSMLRAQTRIHQKRSKVLWSYRISKLIEIVSATEGSLQRYLRYPDRRGSVHGTEAPELPWQTMFCCSVHPPLLQGIRTWVLGKRGVSKAYLKKEYCDTLAEDCWEHGGLAGNLADWQIDWQAVMRHASSMYPAITFRTQKDTCYRQQKVTFTYLFSCGITLWCKDRIVTCRWYPPWLYYTGHQCLNRFLYL